MQIEHLNKETTDGTVRNLDALYQLFPSCLDKPSGRAERTVFLVSLTQIGPKVWKIHDSFVSLHRTKQ